MSLAILSVAQDDKFTPAYAKRGEITDILAQYQQIVGTLGIGKGGEVCLRVEE